MADARKRVVYYVYRSSAAVLQMLQRSIALRLGDRVGWALAKTSPRCRAVLTDNLRHVFGPAVSDEELERAVRRGFSSYGRYWAESALLVAANRAAW